jgi:hypothetical protein
MRTATSGAHRHRDRQPEDGDDGGIRGLAQELRPERDQYGLEGLEVAGLG